MIRGSLISIDAAGCQKEIVKKITSKGADYLIALKANQRALYEFSKDHMATLCDYEHKIYDQFDDSHGRLVRRRVFVAEAPLGFQKMGWSKLSSVVAVETISRRNPDPIESNVSANNEHLKPIVDVPLIANHIFIWYFFQKNGGSYEISILS